MTPPTLIAHADWSLRPEKRWVCVAESSRDGPLAISPPEPVGPTDSFLDRLLARARVTAGGSRLLLGIDAPIGLPTAYAKRAGIQSFVSVLPQLGHDEWSDFYRVSERAEDVSLRRPFYPMRPGGAKQRHLLDGLGVTEMTCLLREAERPTDHRGAAAPLFWTMGARQVGKAAITAWREVLTPALRASDRDVALWPFDGTLHELVSNHRITIAEVYPAEACVQLGLGAPGSGWSKRSRDDRQRHAHALEAWARSRGVTLTPELVGLIRAGFGDHPDGEDRFDAIVGLMSMIDVVQGHRAEGVPDRADIRDVEGWILGRAP